MPFIVYVDDNFHYMDESERYVSGEYDSYDEAVERCKEILEEYIPEEGNCGGKTVAELLRGWLMFGDDPFIVPAGSFSSEKYLKKRLKEVCGE